MEQIKITCPDSHLPKEERITKIINEFEKWFSDKSFVELVKHFGGNIDPHWSTTQKIKWFKEEFSDTWDYRKKQREALTKEGEAARWLLTNNQQINENRELIYKAAERLGLIGIDKTIFNAPDYYLVLGGARMSNLRRCQLAKDEVKRLKNPVTVAALSGMRPIADSEREYIDSYAPGAATEYEAIIEGMKQVFPPLIEINDNYKEFENPNLSYDTKTMRSEEFKECTFYTVAAPSTDPTRRANSADCFKFFFEEFKVPKHAKLVNCTSQIYCGYQHIRSLFFAIDYEVQFDTIGFPFALNNINSTTKNTQLSEPVNYLQELKGSVDAMYDFVMKYSK